MNEQAPVLSQHVSACVSCTGSTFDILFLALFEQCVPVMTPISVQMTVQHRLDPHSTDPP